MSLASGRDDAGLCVVLDLRHPLAYLALRPTLDFARSMALDVDWLPLSVPPFRPPSAAGPDDDRGIRHRRYRAEALLREIHTYAEAQGLVIHEPHRNDDVGLAHLAWLWMREHDPLRLPPFLTELFRAYWALELDASSREAVASQVEAAGADGAAFLAWASTEGPSVAAQIQAELRGRGLFQVPAYLLGGEVFYGRQHLPMLRWILEGRSGPPPI